MSDDIRKKLEYKIKFYQLCECYPEANNLVEYLNDDLSVEEYIECYNNIEHMVKRHDIEKRMMKLLKNDDSETFIQNKFRECSMPF